MLDVQGAVRRMVGQAAGLLLLATLAACGGGGGEGSATPAAAAASAAVAVVAPASSAASAVAADAAPPVPATRTVAQYLQLREPRSATGVLVPPAAAVSARWLADNLALARQQLVSAGQANTVVVPALSYAAHRVLSAAAAGDTRAQLLALSDPSPELALQAAQTGQLQLQAWTETAAPLATAFWQLIDQAAAGPLWASWQAAQAPFDQGEAAALAVLRPDVTALGFDDVAQTRLLLRQRLSSAFNWTGVTPVAGLFERAPQDLLTVQLLRLTAGVRGYDGAGYRADALGSDAGWLLMLRPQAGSLQSFASGPLGAALTDAVAALVSGTGSTAAQVGAGELLLPVGELALPFAPASPLQQAGVTLAFDKVNANFKGLDTLGGTYAQLRAPDVRLQIDGAGLRLGAEQLLAFTFSPLNVNGPSSTGGITTQVGGDVQFCANGGPVWPAADLRPFVLAVLNPQGWVQALVAVNAPVGVPYVPSCP